MAELVRISPTNKASSAPTDTFTDVVTNTFLIIVLLQTLPHQRSKNRFRSIKIFFITAKQRSRKRQWKGTP